MSSYRGLSWLVAAQLALGGAALAQPSQDPVARGRYLVENVAACGNCHTPQGPGGNLPGMTLAGGMVFDEQPFRAVSPNITPDSETGIGRWTDAQLVRAIREGKRPDGTTIGPPMPIELYRGLSDTDVAAMVAYLRTVPPVRNAVARSEYRIPLPPAYGPPVEHVAGPPADDPVARGRYVAGPLGHCVECHTPMGEGGRRDWSKVGGGGQSFEGPWGISVARNITPNPEAGIGRWSDAEIIRAVTEGISADGRRLFPPMGYPYYAGASEGDLRDLVAYLRSLPPVP